MLISPILRVSVCATALAMPHFAFAQTVDDAYVFFDHVMLNSSSRADTMISSGSYMDRKMAVYASRSGNCKSQVFASKDGDKYDALINWAEVADARHFGDQAEGRVAVLGGGETELRWASGNVGEKGPSFGILLTVATASVKERLMKAMAVIQQQCGKKGLKF